MSKTPLDVDTSSVHVMDGRLKLFVLRTIRSRLVWHVGSSLMAVLDRPLPTRFTHIYGFVVKLAGNKESDSRSKRRIFCSKFRAC